LVWVLAVETLNNARYQADPCPHSGSGLKAIHHDPSPAREAHIDRLAEGVRWLPCSPTCSNWLRYGVQPKDAQPGMVPGHCKHKTHDRANLGLGGRRVLVSRKRSGKTLAGHRADRAAVVRAVLEEAGIDPDDHDELSITGTDGRWSWELLGRARVDDRTYAIAIGEQIVTRQRWRNQYEAAKASGARSGPAPPASALVRQFDPPAGRKGVSGGLWTLDGAEGAHALDAQGHGGGASSRPEQAV
jgi:hypothetical protein